MTSAEKLLEILKAKLATEQVPVLRGTVESVDGTTCEVRLTESDLVVHEVLLTAVSDVSDGVRFTPTVGSAVIIAPIGNDINSLYMVGASQLDQATIKIGDTEVVIDKDGVSVTRGGQNLMKVLGEMIDELNKIVVVQGTTINVPAMEAIKEKFKTILKND